MKKQFIFYFFMGLSLLILPNCAKYKPTILPYPTRDVQESEDIKIVTRKLSKTECAICFDSNAVASRYQAIQIYVKNKSDKPIVLSSSNISLPIEKSKNVAKKIHRKTALRIAAYCAGIIPLVPICIIASFFHLFFPPVAILTPIIPATINGVKSNTANRKINHDVKMKVLGQNEQVIIKPHNSINKVVFVSRKYTTKHFNVVLTTEDATQIVSFVCSY